jgi:hypothetical protein
LEQGDAELPARRDAPGHPLAVERYRDPISEVSAKTIRHASELGRWEMVLGDPPPGLCSHVRSYWGYAEETVAFSRRRELATAHAVLIVGFGPPIEVSFPRLGNSVRATAFVSGLSDCYAVVDSFGSQRGVQIDLTPLGAFMLFGLPMRELTNPRWSSGTCSDRMERGCRSACTRRAGGLPASPSSTSSSSTASLAPALPRPTSPVPVGDCARPTGGCG